jgi:hypothetical protein
MSPSLASRGRSSRGRSTGGGRRRGPAGPFGYGDLGTSLVYIFPLFLAYQVGVLFTSSMNGVDFVTRLVYWAVGDRTHYLYVQGALALLYLAYLVYVRRRRAFALRSWPLMVLEAAIYALTLGTAIGLVMEKLLGFELTASALMAVKSLGDIAVISLGAGVYEELVFRVLIMGGGMWLLMKLGMKRWPSLIFALLASAFLFSAAHHVGPMGDPLQLNIFTYRVLAGIAFGLIFQFRSLAHAAYAHFLYDAYVLILRG